MGSKPEPKNNHWYTVTMQTLDNDDGERGPYKGVMFTDCMGNLNFEDRISGIRHMRRPTLEFTTGEPMIVIGFVQVDDDLWVRQAWKILQTEVLEVDDGRKEG